MTNKRGFRVFFYVILLVLSIALLSINWGTITGWVSSIANVALDIQMDLRPPENLTIVVNNQSTGVTTLNWSDSNAQGYYIWYSSNVTEILQLDYSNANLTNLSNVSSPNITLVGKYNTTWEDTNAGAVDKRFYAVAAYTSNGTVFTTSAIKVGKWNITINDETNVKQTLFSTPLEQIIPMTDITPPNNFAWAYAMNYTLQDWNYAYSSSGVWNPASTLINLEFGRGTYFDKFNSVVLFTSAGPIPTGNVTKIIYSESNVTPTILGWESITTNGSTSLITPPNNFAWIYTVNDAADDDWLYAYSSSGVWNPASTLTQFEPGKGYIFNKFNTETNFTYERNTY